MSKLDDPIGVQRGPYAGLGQYDPDFDFPKIPPLKVMGSGNGEVGWKYTETAISSTQRNVSSNLSFPFKIVLGKNNSNADIYTIPQGTITDGTNGPAADISAIIGNEQHAASAGYVVIEATIGADLVASDWVVKVVAIGESKEVKTGEDPVRQTHARLLLGRIVSSGSPAVLSVNTTISISQILTHGLMNGLAVRVFESHPTHADAL